MTQTVSCSPFHVFNVPLGARAYHVVTGDAVLSRVIEHLPDDLRTTLGSRQIFIVTDQTVGALYASALRTSFAGYCRNAAVHSIADGEASKSGATYQLLCDELLAAGIDRQSVIIALGGGVVGDLAGFVAATILRGVNFIQVPTTLLSQVDSSVGGKTGINTSVGKNLIGAFYQPRLVVCDTAVLTTLPPREFAAGMAEIVKAAMLADGDFLGWLENNCAAIGFRDPAALSAMINRAVGIKAQIVAADEREETGLRALLNLGHTFGHAYEAAAGYDGRLLHGEGVAIGLVMAARLSAMMGLISVSDVERVRSLLVALHLPVSPGDVQGVVWPRDDDLIERMRKDKKTSAGQLNFVVLEKIGRAVLRNGIEEQMVRAVLAAS